MKFLGPPSSGSIAGTTSSHNRAGQYTRNRRTPVNPVGTGRRAIARSNFGASSQAWASLTFSQQAAWSAYADSFPIVDSLGQSIKLTGHQMFVSINSQLLNCGQPVSLVPPVSNTTWSESGTVMTSVATGDDTITPTGAGTAADFQLLAFSKPVSSGVSFVKTFWQGAVIAGNLATPQNATTYYRAQFGTPPVGSRIFFKVTPVNQYGVSGTPAIGFCTVT